MLRFRFVPLVICLVLVAAGVQAQDGGYSKYNPFPLKELAGKTLEEVSTILGEQSICGDASYGSICYFREGTVTVAFKGGKADHFVVDKLSSAPFNIQALSIIGLTPKMPDAQFNTSMEWNDIQGVKNVKLFESSDTKNMVGYFYIKAFTE